MNHFAKGIELLAPARDADTAIEAIRHGADAVYIGAPSHGARAAAVNSYESLQRVIDYAHRYGARVYVTVNTIVYDDELADVASMIRRLYRMGTDALIVQDMGLLRMPLPPIALHASTQCDTRDAAKARFLEEAGFSQIVLARELSIAEIRHISEAVSVPLEVFVHGALCVCYSGDCRASLVTTGRSANRGECAQVCRYAFDLIDGDGRCLISDKYLLSLRDMNRSTRLAELIEAGASSFKIEGRLKDTGYVKNVTALYDRLLRDIVDGSEGQLRRTSYGRVMLRFTPDASRSFNRGFTDYFTDGVSRTGLRMASTDTPKSRGRFVATVKGRRGVALIVDAAEELHNGDGLGYTDASGRFCGFRLNRVEGGYLLFPASPVDIPAGTRLYRNRDKAWDDSMAGDTAERLIDVELTLRPVGTSRIALDATDSRGNAVTVTAETDLTQAARSPQLDARRRALEKTGGTIYAARVTSDRCADAFIPLSLLSSLRRDALDALDSAQRITYRYDYRRSETAEAQYITDRLTYHDNVANQSAAAFYRDHGVKDIQEATEVTLKRDGQSAAKRGMRVMTTLYCLRREMGRCLLTPEGKEWKGPLTLVSGNSRFGLDFDCTHCQMHLTKQ